MEMVINYRDQYWDEDDCQFRCWDWHDPDEPCPLCCANGGLYQPGTKECDFCEGESLCRRLAEICY